MILIDQFDAEDTRRITEFTAFQKILYRDDSFFIPDDTVVLPGIRSRYFLARQEDAIRGRAAGLVNPLMTYKGRSAGMVGFFECTKDTAVAESLLSAVREWLREEGCGWCIGPMNGSTWRKYRITVPDPEPPFFLDNHHKSWYQSLFEAAGFSVAERYISTRIPLNGNTAGGSEDAGTFLPERGQRVRPIRMNEYAKDIRAIYDLSVEAFADNALYTPIEADEFQQLYRKAAAIIDPAFVRLCEDEAGELQGFIFAVPDRFQPSPTTLIIKTLAVRSGAKGKGLGGFLVRQLHADARKAGYKDIIHALMHEKNVSTRVADTGAHLLRRYHLYASEL
jgi:L-amino acid N-acyltransferase YncA